MQQMAACANTSRSIDHEQPVQLLLYLQPPAPWVSSTYHGLPVLQIESNSGTNFQTNFGPTAAPAASGPPVFDTPNPTPSPFKRASANITCTDKEHCCFEAIGNHALTPELAGQATVLPRANRTAHTLQTCMTLCTRLLLCRVAVFYHTTCDMYALHMTGRQSRAEDTYYVHTVEDQCTPSPAVATTGVQVTQGHTTLVKQDCCLHTLL